MRSIIYRNLFSMVLELAQLDLLQLRSAGVAVDDVSAKGSQACPRYPSGKVRVGHRIEGGSSLHRWRCRSLVFAFAHNQLFDNNVRRFVRFYPCVDPMTSV